MKNIFEIATICLQRADIEEKLSLTHHAWQLYQDGELELCSRHSPAAIEMTQFPDKPVLCSPKAMPRRTFATEAGIIAAFHSTAHIEFIAIYLAWDILYRFRDMPDQFYIDWLRVADEEAQHFTLIRNYLKNKGVDYGDLPAHQGLWERAEQTADDLLDRLALVPRGMEARGLDVTPGMIEKCKGIGDSLAEQIFTRILNDEVGHVELGSYWFKFVCKQRGYQAEEKYRELIIKFLNGKPKGPFNRDMRINAGFSESELKWLEN